MGKAAKLCVSVQSQRVRIHAPGTLPQRGLACGNRCNRVAEAHGDSAYDRRMRCMRRIAIGALCMALLAACQTPFPASPTPLDTATAPVAVVTVSDSTPPLPPLPTVTRGVVAAPMLTFTPTPISSTARALTRTIALPIVSTHAETPAAQSAAAPTPAPTAAFDDLPKIDLRGQGIDVADYADMALPRDLGFGWVQVYNPPEYPIDSFKILYRVPLDKAISGQAADIAAWADALEALARDRQGVINAYSIGNEVNLSREWGGSKPDPLAYTRLLAIAYARIKQADPQALVISAGIAPTGGDGDGFADDLVYARTMFEAGALDVMDAYGFHPYGFAYEPERDPADAQTKGLLFRRAEAHRALMQTFGGADKKIWATEFGWLINPDEEGVKCTLPGMDWQRVSKDNQAKYVVRAYDYASKNWAWMGPMFLWNLDFSRSSLYPDPCEQMKWFSLYDAAGNQRPLAQALRNSRR
jgi:hypothetical protein